MLNEKFLYLFPHLFCYQSSLSTTMDFIERNINKLAKFIHTFLTICVFIVFIVFIICFHIFQLNVMRQFAEYQD